MSDLFSLPFEEDRKPAPPAPPQRRVVTVSELTNAIRDLLETGFGDIWVEGEISNCRLWNTGHLYFTLKDGGAQIKGVMFRSAVRYLKFKPEDGLHVIARGRLGIYGPKGEYQLACEHLEPRGLGALQLPSISSNANSRRKGCSIRRASGRSLRCPAGSGSSRRSTARRSATSSRC